jgi:hypothetical protein
MSPNKRIFGTKGVACKVRQFLEELWQRPLDLCQRHCNTPPLALSSLDQSQARGNPRRHALCLCGIRACAALRRKALVNRFEAFRESLEPNSSRPWIRYAAPPLRTCVITKTDLMLPLLARTACPTGSRSVCPVATGRSKTSLNNFSSGSLRASPRTWCPATLPGCRASSQFRL